jgi:hypothetical protein
VVARPYALHTMPMGNTDVDVRAVVRASNAINYSEVASLSHSSKVVFLPPSLSGTAVLLRALMVGDKPPKNATGQSFVTATTATKALEKAAGCDFIITATQTLADTVNNANFNALKTEGKRTDTYPMLVQTLSGEPVDIDQVASTLPASQVNCQFAIGQQVRVVSDGVPAGESPFASVTSLEGDAVVVALHGSNKRLRVQRTCTGAYHQDGRLLTVTYMPLAAARAVSVHLVAQHHFDKPALYFRAQSKGSAPPPHVILAMLACCRNPAAAVYINVTQDAAWFGSSGLLHMWGVSVLPTARSRLAAASASIAVRTMLKGVKAKADSHGKPLTAESLLVTLPWDKVAPTADRCREHQVDVRTVLRASEVAVTAGCGGRSDSGAAVHVDLSLWNASPAPAAAGAAGAPGPQLTVSGRLADLIVI